MQSAALLPDPLVAPGMSLSPASILDDSPFLVNTAISPPPPHTTATVGTTQKVKLLFPNIVSNANGATQCVQLPLKRARLSTAGVHQPVTSTVQIVGGHDPCLNAVLGSKVKIQPKPFQSVLKTCNKPAVQSPSKFSLNTTNQKLTNNLKSINTIGPSVCRPKNVNIKLPQKTVSLLSCIW